MHAKNHELAYGALYISFLTISTELHIDIGTLRVITYKGGDMAYEIVALAMIFATVG